MKKLKEHQKVFGIGLSKTGTSTLGNALNILGIKTIHYPYDQKTYDELTKGDYKLSVLEEYQGITDITVSPYYAQLDKIYPESKFILTIREQDSWLRSVSGHWDFMLEWWKRDKRQLNKFSQFIFACVYGTLEFNEDRFLYVYDTHLQNVCDYFKSHSNDLLIMDICDGDGWEKLCPYLGLPIPNIPFPHSNKRSDKNLGYMWMDWLDLATKEIATLIALEDIFILVDQQQFGSEVTAGRRAIPFLEQKGEYWGPPPDDSTAIRELERLRKSGAKFIVFGWPAFWWLDYYSELNHYLCSNYRILLQNDRLIVFDLFTKNEIY